MHDIDNLLVVNLIRFGRKELYKLQVGYDPELISNIKKLPYAVREWNQIGKEWYLTAMGVYGLMSFYKGREDIHFKFEDDKQRTQFSNIIKKHKERLRKEKEARDNLENHNREILDYKGSLPVSTNNFDYSKYLKEGIIPMEHQIYGAHFSKWLLDRGKNVLINFEMGTGKSLTSILTVEMMDNVKKCLFIVPSGLRVNIAEEINKFTHQDWYIPNVKKRKDGTYYLSKYKRNDGREMKDCKYIILSYDYFGSSKFDSNKRIKDLGLHEVDLIVYDEYHVISNKKTNRSVNIEKSYNGIVDNFIALTATPLKGANLQKFFPILKKIKPEEFTNEAKFLKEYAGLQYGKNGWGRGEYYQVSEPNLKGLHKVLETFSYRVKTSDVLKLPGLRDHKIMIELTDSQKKEYEQIESGFAKVNWLKRGISELEEGEHSAMGVMIRLRQYLGLIKVQKCVEIIQSLNEVGEKTILFDLYKDPLRELKKELGSNSEMYSGDDDLDRKTDLRLKFQDKDSDLQNLLLSMIAGNAGITLTEATNVILNTMSFVPSDNVQSIARAYRKGQEFSVDVYTMIVADTIDEDIYETLAIKESVIKAVIDGEEYVDERQTSVVDDLLDKIKQKWKK